MFSFVFINAYKRPKSFTTIILGGIILTVKLCKNILLSLVAIICTATISVGTAFALDVQTETVYPENFECSLSFDGGLVDYAVYGDSYAFAYSGQLAVLSGNGNGERLPDIKPVSSITQLEYSAQGELYVCFENEYCVYPDLEQKRDLSEITIQKKGQNLVTVDGASYALDKNNGSMLYLDGSFTPVTLQETYEGEIKFSNLKTFNGTAYAVMNNCLYKMEGATAVKINPTYYGFIDMTKAISTGTAAQALTADNPITYGWLEKNEYYTQINLENGLGATFEIANPTTATTLSADRLYCMVIAESGNAYIITMNGKSYLTAKTSVSVESDSPALSPADTQVAYAIETTGIYSRPYLSKATKIFDLKSGSSNAVTVLGLFEDLTGIEYYKINYTDSDGTQVTGYVAKRLMTSYSFPTEDDAVHPDGGDNPFVYDNNIVTVVLAVAIVALVLAAILYISITASKNSNSGKRGKEMKKSAKQEQLSPIDEEE